MKLTMLGTGNALAVNYYNTCYLLEENGEYLLVDGGGGNGVLKQLRSVNVNFRDIHHVFVTHKHVDHILGVIWMVRMFGQFMSVGDYAGEAYIYGHEEVIHLIEEIAGALIEGKATRYIHDRIHLVPLRDKEVIQVLGHPMQVFDIRSKKTKQFGYRMEYAKGKFLTCLGDENYNETEEDYVRGSDWLFHEAFCLASEADIFHPYEKGHSTVKDACELAERLQVKNLLLYHTEDSHASDRKRLYLAEGKRFFDGTLVIPDDLESLEIV